jgi:formate hydrogenlyase subunit 3/multisubunit Na+/H+ antiporter MnhD subunit
MLRRGSTDVNQSDKASRSGNIRYIVLVLCVRILYLAVIGLLAMVTTDTEFERVLQLIGEMKW